MNDEITQKQRTFVAILQQIPGVAKHLFVQVTQRNQNILKIEKKLHFHLSRNRLVKMKVWFFLFSICITLYLRVSSTVLWKN